MNAEMMFRLHAIYTPNPGPLARPLSEGRELDAGVRGLLLREGYMFIADLILFPPTDVQCPQVRSAVARMAERADARHAPLGLRM